MATYELKDTLVSIEDVSLSFGERAILKPTTVQVRDVVRPGTTTGQIVGILGPSGVGKTQFSRCLSGLQQPTSGVVKVMGSDGQLAPVTPGVVGVVFQDYPLFMHRTVLGNLMVAQEHNPDVKAREAKALEYLQRFGLQGKEGYYPSQLSGGQRQRVSIIQELLSSEHFLVMDEPFTGLDPLMKDKVCELINQVASLDEKNTIFVVAHDIQALVSIADTLWLFGRDRDEKGEFMPGASIKHQYDLIRMGLAWHPNISSTHEFHLLVDEIKERFRGL